VPSQTAGQRLQWRGPASSLSGGAEKFYLKCGWTLAEQGIADGESYAFMIREL